jgi:hypothetical protein
MTMDINTCCQKSVTGGQPRNPTSAKTGQIWGTRHSLRIEIALPDHRLPRGVCEKFMLNSQILVRRTCH